MAARCNKTVESSRDVYKQLIGKHLSYSCYCGVSQSSCLHVSRRLIKYSGLQHQEPLTPYPSSYA